MVLIVEDDPDMQTLERMAFECGGYEVATARNGREALDHLRHDTRPSVILLDLMMPVMDGLTFLKERRREGMDDIPVICVSAGGPEMLSAARDLGASACVAKPVDFDDLCEMARQYSANDF